MNAPFDPPEYNFKGGIVNKSAAGWYKFVSLAGFFVSGIVLMFHLLNLAEAFLKRSCLVFEMLFSFLWSFFYLTCFMDLLVKGSQSLGSDSYVYEKTGMDYFLTYGTAAFCLFGALIHGIDGFLKLRLYQK